MVFIMNNNTEQKMEVTCKCSLCNKEITLLVFPQDLVEYHSPNRRHIQDIFPYLTAPGRELLISGTCEDCWNMMFSDEDEDEEYEPTAEDLKEWQYASCGRC